MNNAELIKLGETYNVSGGEKKAEVIAVGLEGEFDVMAILTRESLPGRREASGFSSETLRCEKDCCTLELPPKSLWVNAYEDSGFFSVGMGQDSKERADSCTSSNRIACIEVSFVPGEGL